jgi:hypothetical protein
MRMRARLQRLERRGLLVARQGRPSCWKSGCSSTGVVSDPPAPWLDESVDQTPLILAPRERHQQRTKCSFVYITLAKRAWFVATGVRTTPPCTVPSIIRRMGGENSADKVPAQVERHAEEN